MLGSRACGLMAIPMFLSLAWGPRFALFDFWRPDAAAFLIVTLAVRAALARRAGWLAAALAVGVLVKESVLFAGPLYYTLNAGRPVEARLLARCAAAMAPAVAVLAAVRLTIPALNADAGYMATVPFAAWTDASYGYWTLLGTVGRWRLLRLSAADVWTYTVGTFGVAPVLLACLAPRDNAVRLVRFLPFLALVYAQILFAMNIQRLLVLAFPAVIPLALDGLRTLARHWRLPVAALLPVPLASFSATLFAMRGFSPDLGAEAVLLAIAITLVYAARRPRPAAGHPFGAG
jgi:hypothetical protein